MKVEVRGRIGHVVSNRPELVAALLAVALACTGCLGREPERQAAPPAAPSPSSAPRDQSAPSQGREEKGGAEADPARSLGAPPRPAESAPQAPAGSAAPRRAAPKAVAPEMERKRSGAESAEQDDVRSDPAAPSSPQLLMQRLGAASSLATPDCPSARERKKAICDLATQICQLVDRDPNVASVESYCSEARQRCSEADRRTQDRCGG